METYLDVLPYEILFEIVTYLEFDDFVNLTTAKQALLEDDRASKFIAMVSICDSILNLTCPLY